MNGTFILFTLAVILCTQKGRLLVGLAIRFAMSALGSYSGSTDHGPHYDHVSGEVHSHKEIGGMYRK